MHERTPPQATVVTLRGHVDRKGLLRAFAAAEGSSRAMIIDCREMEGYDPDTRQAFVDWHRRHATPKVAIVTRKRTWHMLTSAMSLASRRSMRAFDTMGQARAWIGLDAPGDAAAG